MAMLECFLFPCLSDNYGVLIHDPDTGETASVDAPDPDAVIAAAEQTGWSLTHILCTHHHADHTQGIAALKKKYECTVIGPRGEADKIADLDVSVGEGDTIAIGNNTAAIYETPGHTLGHIAYWFKDSALLFAGDTLFAMGCGRVFEGSYEQMWSSLSKLAALPPETKVYCGHEYTLSNARFAASLDPGNTALAERLAEIEALREEGKPTIPTTIEKELATNPFLRAKEPSLQASLGMEGADPAAVFAEVRRRKDAA